MNAEKMTRMANQIATFFATQPGDIAPAEIADHLTKFWEPRMKQQLYAHVDGGGAGLDTTVLEAVRLMRTAA